MSYIEENGYFTFDGVQSSDYGVWINGGGSYNAPARRGKEYVIPGRNGVLTIDDGTFEELEVTYPAFIAREFPSNIEGIRNELLSRVGYVRLEDTYHPDEYYRARFAGGLEADVVSRGTAGSFNLKFRRDPRRFLKTGETPKTVGAWGETETASGEVATFECKEGEAIKSLIAYIEPVQASGTPTPSSPIPITGWTGANVVVSPTLDAQDGTTYTLSWQADAGTVYGGHVDFISGKLVVDKLGVDLGSITWTKHATRDYYYCEPSNIKGANTNGTVLDGAYCSAYVVGAYLDPYDSRKENCIGVSTGGRVAIRDTYAAENSLSADDFQTYVTGKQFVYPLVTPIEYNLTAQSISPLVGVNNVYADTGSASVEYGEPPGTIINPTLFASKPLIEAKGSGTITIGSDTITIAGISSITIVYIDCELQECYTGGGVNVNNYVTFPNHKFPVLKPGTTTISGTTTTLKITPRWWKI